MAQESTLVNSFVGPGTYVKGQIDVSGLLRIDGDFSGTVKTVGRVIIGSGGRADCTIDANTVVVGGVVRGTIYASDKVIVLESALVIGSVYAPRFICESGAIVDGALHVRGQKTSDRPHSVPTPGPSSREKRPDHVSEPSNASRQRRPSWVGNRR